MDTDTIPQTTIDRRELWLTIALAVARDGLPEPEISYSRDGNRYMYLETHSHAEAIVWANHLDPAPVITHWQRSELGRRYVKADVKRDGWHINIVGVEPIPPAHPELAAAVVGAILQPDEEATP